MVNESENKGIDRQLRKLELMKRERPRWRLWDGDYRFITDCSADCIGEPNAELLCNDSGVAELTLASNSPSFKLASAVLYGDSSSDLHLTVDTANLRWSGKLDNAAFASQERSEGIDLTLQFIHDYEYLKRTTVWNSYFLPPMVPFQPGAFFFAGPSGFVVRSVIALALWNGLEKPTHSMWRAIRGAVSIVNRRNETIVDPVKRIIELATAQNRHYVIHGMSLLESLAAGDSWTVVTGSYLSIHDMVADVLAHENITVTVKRHLDEDRSDSHLMHGGLVISITRRKQKLDELFNASGILGAGKSGLVVSNAIRGVGQTVAKAGRSIVGLFTTPERQSEDIRLSTNYTGRLDYKTAQLPDLVAAPAVVFESDELSQFNLSLHMPVAAAAVTRGEPGAILRLITTIIRVVIDTVSVPIAILPMGTMLTDVIDKVTSKIFNSHPMFYFDERLEQYGKWEYPNVNTSMTGKLLSLAVAANRAKAHRETDSYSTHEIQVDSDTAFVPGYHFQIGEVVGSTVYSSLASQLTGRMFINSVSGILITSGAGATYAVTLGGSAYRPDNDLAYTLSRINILTNIVREYNVF